MSKEEKHPAVSAPASQARNVRPCRRRTKFQVYGEEMIEKGVKRSGALGRVYLPSDWVGKSVKIIRLD